MINGQGSRENMKRAMSNGSINVNDLPRENGMNQQRAIMGSKSTGYLSDGEAYRQQRGNYFHLHMKYFLRIYY